MTYNVFGETLTLLNSQKTPRRRPCVSLFVPLNKSRLRDYCRNDLQDVSAGCQWPMHMVSDFFLRIYCLLVKKTSRNSVARSEADVVWSCMLCLICQCGVGQ